MDLKGKIFDDYKIDSLPTTYLIDQSGEVIGLCPLRLAPTDGCVY